MRLQDPSIPVPEESNSRLDWGIEGILAALLAFMPLTFGAVHPWSEQVVIVLAAGISILFAIKLLLSPRTGLAWSWAYLAVAVFLLVGAIQLIPLPASVVQAISPNTVALRTELLADQPDSEELLATMTLSFYPRATRHNLRLVLAVAAVFFVVANYYRDPRRIKRLLTVVAAIGGAIAVLALAQTLVGNGKIYWVVPTYKTVANSGPFINHSHYGQFMNLSIGAALGLLLVRMHEGFTGRTVTPARVFEYFGSPEARTTKLLLAMIVLGVATVFLSLTRGGMISMLIAAGFTTLMLSWRQSLHGRGWIMVMVALAAFLCVLWVGFDEVYDRLATLQDLQQAESGRWQIIQDIALAWTKFPVLGTGLGTHEVVYPMFDRSTIASWAMHAENEYAQAAEETGLVGLLALVVFGIVIWANYARSMNVASAPIRSAAYGLGFGLLAILVHSLSDFGQHLPANAMLSAVSCGLLIGLTRVAPEAKRQVSRVKRREQGPALALQTPNFTLQKPSMLRIPLRAVLLIAVIGAFAWAALGADRARVAAWHWRRVLGAERQLEAHQWLAAPEAYEYLFTHAMAAVEAEPDNIHYQHWLRVYMWHSMTPYTDPNTGGLASEVLPWAREIVEELRAIRPLCPTHGATWSLAGQIEKFVLMDPAGAERIRTGYRLAPCDAMTCIAAALCDAAEGEHEAAFEKLSRAVQLDGGLFRQAVQICLSDLNRPDLALELAGDQSGRLAHVSNALATARKGGDGESDLYDLASQAEARAFEQLRLRCEQTDAPASAHASLANLYRRRGDPEAAIAQYRRALMKDYSQVGWHYALAQLLADADHIEEAIRHARICLRLRADYTAAKRLIEQLALRSAALPSANPAAN